MKEKYAKELKEILSCLNIEIAWEGIRDSSDFEEYIVNPFKENYKHSFKWDSGASKGVLVFADLGFVLKIPFHVVDEDYYYDDDYEETDSIDYCALEADFYYQAKKIGLGDVFAQTEYVTMFDGDCPIYIQEYVESRKIDEDNCIYTEKDKETVNSLNETEFYDDDIDVEWEAELLAQKGLSYYRKFKKFVFEHDINDLRYFDNIGYTGGRPICFDFSGYHS
jgi:hypothetical protein